MSLIYVQNVDVDMLCYSVLTLRYKFSFQTFLKIEDSDTSFFLIL